MRYCSLLIHFLGFLYSAEALGQFGNEWINFNQTYYKIPVARKGIYRLTYNDLIAAGVPLNSIDTRRIQIFRRGVEQSIRFSISQTPDNNIFEAGEFIEFYGDKNDGANDVDLYKNPAHHPHSYYNLYSDTAAYFLTWNLAAVQGKRMTELAPEAANISPEEGFTNTVLQIFNNQYSGGVLYKTYIHNSFFDEGEGWTGLVICTVNSGCTGFRDFTINIPKGVTSLPPPKLEALLVGRAEVGHAVEIYAGPSANSLRLVSESTFQNFQSVKATASLSWADVAANGTVTIRVQGLGVGGVRESISVSYLKIDYARDFDFTGLTAQAITLKAKTGNRSFVEITNAPSGLRLFDVTDLQAIKLIGTNASGTQRSTLINGTGNAREIYADSRTITPPIKKVSFKPIKPTNNNYIIISHESLRKPALSYSDPVNAYAAYRASPEGGGYDTVVVNSSQLYNQFNYGETSARAVYQFLKFMDKGSGDTRYLFIIGKGMELNIAYDRLRPLSATGLQDLVPTAGHPGSDLTFSVGLRGTTMEPSIPTGRLVATTPTDVAVYLNKIKETESLPFDNLWRKNLLHLSGGINAGEPQAFRYFVDGFKSIAEKVYMGAHVETKSKQSFDLETIPVPEQVNNGVSLITFFGHSTTVVLDFEIGYVTNPTFGYNNKGKYPAFLINGCNVGRIYDNRTGAQRSFGEDWMIAADRGAKSFIAHSSFGFETSLRQYSELFYQSVFGDSIMITKGIGDAQIQVAKKILASGGASINNLSMTQQMVLMGDPAVAVFGAPKPDYAIHNDFLKEVSLDGNPITAASPAIGIKYKIRNYGQSRSNPISVKLTRAFSDNTTKSYDTLVAPVPYESEFVFVIPNESITGGQNSFTITIDSEQEQQELSEENNQATLDLFIPSSSTFNLSPYPHSIVNSPSVELVFQNTNQYPAYRDYQIEIDTVPAFNSSFRIQKKIRANVLGRTTIALASKDSTVYYWRTRLDNPLLTESNEWFTTSFSYISNGGEGWAQLRKQQLSENTFTALELNSSTGDYTFPGKPFSVFVQNFGSANPNEFTRTSFKVNNEEWNVAAQGVGCRNNSVNVVAFDKNTGNPYAPSPYRFVDTRTCGKEPQVINNFVLTQINAASGGLATAISSIAISDSVVLFTIGDASVDKWTTATLTKLGEIGISASQLSGYTTGEPLIIFGKKGSAPGSARVFRASTTPLNEQELVVNETITARPTTGTMRSTVIGPAKSWSKLYRKVADVGVTDAVLLRVIGIKDGSPEKILFSGNSNAIDLTFIDARTYPNIKIELQTTDVVGITPVDLRNWVVRYTPVAEGILLLRGSVAPVTRNEGQSLSTKFSFVNVTRFDFPPGIFGESMDAQLRVINQETGRVQTQTLRFLSPLPLDSAVLDWTIETNNLDGMNDFQFSVNNLDVQEKFYFNNRFFLDNHLNVIQDNLPPVLDVTVDGRYLFNGDVVSPNPHVQIKIIDESYYNPKTDTLGIEIMFRNIETNVAKRINFNDPALIWNPATADSDFTISFTTSLAPGEYELSVQGVDASGNPGGNVPYSVSFVVTDEFKVQIGSPYPNPSNSNFTFPVFISGLDLPSSFSMKIFAPDGRLVKLFTLADAEFYIGSNYLRWDASKSNEDSLTSGVYYFNIKLAMPKGVFSKSGRMLFIKP